MTPNKFPLRAAAVCVSLACLLPALQTVQAAASPQDRQTTVSTCSPTAIAAANQTILILPRYNYITRISSSLSISNSGYANCTGGYTIYDEYSGNITITLQKFSNSRWSDVKEWSEDFSATDTGAHMLNKGYYVGSGYRYRVVAVVKITDTDGTVLENESCDSPVSEY